MKTLESNVYEVEEIPQLYIDAYAVSDESDLVFGSFWGTETVIKEFLARLMLKEVDGGLNGVSFYINSNNLKLKMANANELQKKTMKTPSETKVGSLIHTWIYDPTFSQVSARSLYVMCEFSECENQIEEKLWTAVKQLCHVPLLEVWKDALMKAFRSKDWIKQIHSMGLNAWHINLTAVEEIEELIHRLVVCGVLTKTGCGDPDDLPTADQKDLSPLEEILGEVIHSYTRKEAIEDGFLVDVTVIAKEAGIKFPVAMTRDVWEKYVEWTDEDNKRKGAIQDQEGRLWDVVYMLSVAIRRCKVDASTLKYELYIVPREGKGKEPRSVHLWSEIGPGDNGEPVITIKES